MSILKFEGEHEDDRGNKSRKKYGNGTSGVWIWGEFLQYETQEPRYHVVLDFEGLAPDEKGVFTERDRKMFALASVLCSTIFFNSKIDFNHEKLMEIALIDDLYRKIKISDKDFNPTITPEGRGGKNERVSTHQENSK